MSKSYAIFAAILMIAVGGIVVFNDSDNADAQTETTTTGLVKVNYYNGSTWSATTVDAFDVYQAVAAAKTVLGYTFTVDGDNSTYNTLVGSGEWAYYDIDADYGTLATVNGSTNFSVKVYNGSAWVAAQPALGWYRPFADYASAITFADGSSAGAANVAIIADSADVVPESTPLALTAIQQTVAFEYTFFLIDLTGELDQSLIDGLEVVGYGSDAYLAFLNATGVQVTGQNMCVKINDVYDENHVYQYSYNTYYSWIDTICGAGTITDHNAVTGVYTYTYWASFDANEYYLDYTLGYYSKLSGAPNNLDYFMFYYMSM